MLKDLRCCSSVHILLSPGFLTRLSLGLPLSVSTWYTLKALRDTLWCYYRPYTVSSESQGLVSLRRLAPLLQTSGWTCMFLNHISLSQFPVPKPAACQGCQQHTENLGEGGDGRAHHLSMCYVHFFWLFSWCGCLELVWHHLILLSSLFPVSIGIESTHIHPCPSPLFLSFLCLFFPLLFLKWFCVGFGGWHHLLKIKSLSPNILDT